MAARRAVTSSISPSSSFDAGENRDGGGGGGGNSSSSSSSSNSSSNGGSGGSGGVLESPGLQKKGFKPGGARGVCALLLKHWFLVGTALSIVMAQQAPWVGSDAGPLHPQVTVKYFAVMSIFFISGVSMKTETMWGTITDYRMHAFIQGFALLVVPVLVRLLLLPLLAFCGLHPSLLKGFMVVGCMPPPVSTSVILTKTAGGNEAAAIFNSALGSFLGVIVTPIELLLLVDPSGTLPVLAGSSSAAAAAATAAAASAASSSPPPAPSSVALLAQIFAELSFTVVLPLIVGQLLRPRLGAVVDRHKPQLSNFSSFTLLVIIYTTFCNTFCGGRCGGGGGGGGGFMDADEYHSSRQLGAAESSADHSGSGSGAGDGPFSNVTTGGLVFTGVVVALLQLCLMAIVFRLACSRRLNRRWRLNFSRPDVVAVVFSAVHKSLTLGVPVLKVVFSTSPILPLLSTPLLMYHPLQIVLGGLAAPLIKTWVLSPDKDEHQRGILPTTSSSSLSSSSLSSSSSSLPPPPPLTAGSLPQQESTSLRPTATSQRKPPSPKRPPQERFIPYDVHNPL